MSGIATFLPWVLAAAAAVAPAVAQQHAVDETIGSWRLSCAIDRMTDQTACTLLLAQPAERSEPGRPALALEILDRGGRLVPAVTARELTFEGASRALLAIAGTAQLRFPPSPLFEMPCGMEGRSLVCAPRPGPEAERAERELGQAERVLLRMVGTGGGGSAAAPTELPLSRTREAMARYRQLVPAGSTPPPPPPPGLDAAEMLQRLRQMLGL